MTDVVPDSSNDSLKSGNTKQISAAVNWCFTFPNYDEQDLLIMRSYLDNYNKSSSSNKRDIMYIIGREICPTTGTPHLQGYIKFNTKIRPKSITEFSNKIHWEKCKGTENENIDYCSKDGNFITNYPFVKRPLKLIPLDQLFPWQLELLEIIKKPPDDRKIYWYWCEKGRSGKTSFCKLLAAKYAGVVIGGKHGDALYAAAQIESNLYIMDLERSSEVHVSYSAIESIKNGLFFSHKYKSEMINRNVCHFIVFANFPPEESKLSADRWVIKELNPP